MLRSRSMNTKTRRRRDWKGERVMVGARITPALKDELRRRAKAEGLTFSEYVGQTLERALNGCKP
jgi:hypothetical protein